MKGRDRRLTFPLVEDQFTVEVWHSIVSRQALASKAACGLQKTNGSGGRTGRARANIHMSAKRRPHHTSNRSELLRLVGLGAYEYTPPLELFKKSVASWTT